MNFQKLKDFFIKLRAADEPTRKKWLYIFTATAMIIIISLWLLYARLSFGLLASPETAKTETGFFTVLGKGFETIFQTVQRRTANTLNFFQKKIQQENTIEIKK